MSDPDFQRVEQHREANIAYFGADYPTREIRDNEVVDCWCWTDAEFAARNLYCPICTEEAKR